MSILANRREFKSKPLSEDIARIQKEWMLPFSEELKPEQLKSEILKGRTLSFQQEKDAINWIIFDIDQSEKSFSDTILYLSNISLTPYLAYETFTSTKEKPRFRILYQCSEPINELEHSSIYMVFEGWVPWVKIDRAFLRNPKQICFGTSSDKQHYQGNNEGFESLIKQAREGIKNGVNPNQQNTSQVKTYTKTTFRNAPTQKREPIWVKYPEILQEEPNTQPVNYEDFFWDNPELTYKEFHDKLREIFDTNQKISWELLLRWAPCLMNNFTKRKALFQRSSEENRKKALAIFHNYGWSYGTRLYAKGGHFRAYYIQEKQRNTQRYGGTYINNEAERLAKEFAELSFTSPKVVSE